MILLIDNYDSFVHNLARYVRQLGYQTAIFRNDELTISEILTLGPEKIIISPGPGYPDQAGISLEVVKTLGHRIPILGICLGHQAIAKAFGATIMRAKKIVHGKSSAIQHAGKSLFYTLPSPLKVGRYHSLIVAQNDFPSTLEILAWSEEQEIMALQHQDFPVFGLQFHPESIHTDYGYALLANFLRID